MAITMEYIEAKQNEVEAISQVAEKLFKTQNSKVFDKLCIKCNRLLLSMPSKEEIPSLSKENINGLLNVLYRLRDVCNKLKNYKQYLMSVIPLNIENTIQEIKQEEVKQPLEKTTKENPFMLELKQNESERNAA